MMKQHWLRRPASLGLAALISLSAFVGAAQAEPVHQTEHGHGADPAAPASAPNSCQSWPSSLPLGALPGQPPPVWCSPLEQGPPTFIDGPNSWLDEFDHGLSHASLGEGYRVFETAGASINKSAFFRHNEHWMVDVSGVDADGGPPWNFGGALMRPDRAFRFEQGKLVVEADAAAGIAEYGGSAWPELIVSTSPAPTSLVDDLYGYGTFKGFWTVGCRLQSSRSPICAMYDDTGRGAGTGGRRFEISSFQSGGAAQTFGGGPFTPETDRAWRACQGTDPDTNCRDRFRWELTRDTLTLYVNGVLYMQHQGLPPNAQLPDTMLNGDVYVYFASWIYKPDAEAVRFHWDRLAVNPGTPPSAPDLASTPSSAQDAHAHGGGAPAGNTGAAASATDASTPNATPPAGLAITFDDKPGEAQPLNGEYPVGVIDWGTNSWYLSGPFARFSSKSISFNGTGIVSAPLMFRNPRQLVRLAATNGGTVPSTVQLTCEGQPTVTAQVAVGQLATIETGWTGTCTTVTIASSNGWDTNFDDLVLAPVDAASAPSSMEHMR